MLAQIQNFNNWLNLPEVVKLFFLTFLDVHVIYIYKKILLSKIHQLERQICSWNFFENVFIKKNPSGLVLHLSCLIDSIKYSLSSGVIFVWYNKNTFEPFWFLHKQIVHIFFKNIFFYIIIIINNFFLS